MLRIIDENVQFFVDMKKLVEETYALNNNQRITFVVHSMGGPMTLLFLQMQSKEWKEKYIARMISLAGAWAGSVKALKVYAVGKEQCAFNKSFSINIYYSIYFVFTNLPLIQATISVSMY